MCGKETWFVSPLHCTLTSELLSDGIEILKITRNLSRTAWYGAQERIGKIELMPGWNLLESGVIKKSNQMVLRQSPGKPDNSSAPDMKVEIPFTLALSLAKISSLRYCGCSLCLES